MTSFEDHFSEQARQYASNRPRYPGELFAYLASISPDHQLTWDCGTGNGQAAQELAKHFNRVFATDASPDQIAQAVAHERIEYRVERAEQVSLEPGSVDLVTVATAVHWFDYLAERYRTLPFPFKELNPPNFEMQAEWELGRLVGFLDSWSATRRYQKERGQNPINLIWQDLSEMWGEPGQPRKIRWPLYLRIGQVK